MNIGIICEYNPFHNGHKYQIEKIREHFGSDANIIALMSGNFVQRGGVAIADKGLRAKCAVENGVNLVLELPFPFSMSSADYFARASVHILNSLGCIDYISFGSESGRIDELSSAAEVMLSKQFDNEISKLLSDPKTKKLGYASLCEMALNNLPVSSISLTPNNILAIEYIKAIKRSGSCIKVHTIKRAKNSFSDDYFVPGDIQSASAIRKSISDKDITALEFVPQNTKKIILDAISYGAFPCDNERIAPAVIAALRLDSPSSQESIHDTQGGLYNRLRDLSFEAKTIENLICAAESKSYTKARIRRTLFYSLMGVTSSHFNELPVYTQLLAIDQKGRAILKTIGKRSDFTILTKPSDYQKLPDQALPQKILSDKADSIFQMTKPASANGNDALRFTPYVKK